MLIVWYLHTLLCCIVAVATFIQLVCLMPLPHCFAHMRNVRQHYRTLHEQIRAQASDDQHHVRRARGPVGVASCQNTRTDVARVYALSLPRITPS